MRKLFTLLAVVAALSVAVPSRAQFQFGLKGGLNTNEMSFNRDFINTSTSMGFFIGPTVKFKVPIVNIGFDVSAMYDQREVQIEDVKRGGNLRQKQIVVPINLRYDFGLADIVGIFIAAGPQFGFNVGCKDFTLREERIWNLKSANTSINVGAGVMLLNHVQVGANYNIACGRTGDYYDHNQEEGFARAHWNTWQVSLAYYF
ncbi:MAG: porin family protein [Prevotella sp.]|nr:porin family protein [Prevotella sp.]